MSPIQHPTNNRVLGAPQGVPIEDCKALAVTDTVMNDAPAVASFWRPDALELAMLNAGKAVVLCVQGQTHAPLYVGVEA
jgi:hypothetical protein